MADKYRLVTRSDFDGLVCGALLNSLNMIDDVKFVHPKDMQDGKVEITSRDITTNLPYVEGVHIAFDHHTSELERVGTSKNYITDPDAASCALAETASEWDSPRAMAALRTRRPSVRTIGR